MSTGGVLKNCIIDLRGLEGSSVGGNGVVHLDGAFILSPQALSERTACADDLLLAAKELIEWMDWVFPGEYFLGARGSERREALRVAIAGSGGAACQP